MSPRLPILEVYYLIVFAFSFSNLFASPAPISSPSQVGIRYTATSNNVTPALDAMRRRARAAEQGTDVARTLMDSNDLSTESKNDRGSQECPSTTHNSSQNCEI